MSVLATDRDDDDGDAAALVVIDLVFVPVLAPTPVAVKLRRLPLRLMAAVVVAVHDDTHSVCNASANHISDSAEDVTNLIVQCNDPGSTGECQSFGSCPSADKCYCVRFPTDRHTLSLVDDAAYLVYILRDSSSFKSK